MSRNRLTNNSDETEIASLISGDTVFSIPYFQRPYKWKIERLKKLNSDIEAIIDGQTDFHFLGAVIVHGRRSNPSDPTVFDVIDGQQRLTSLFIYLCAIVKVLVEEGNYDEAIGLFQKYIVIPRQTKLASNLRLHSCSEDRAQLKAVIQDILSDSHFASLVDIDKIRFLPESGPTSGRLKSNYRFLYRHVRSKKETSQDFLSTVEAVSSAILEKMSVVQIDVKDPTSGPKIFDSLNSRQEPMTIGDLIRNEIFSKVSSLDPSEVEQIHEQVWKPFYERFKEREMGLFDKYFFPFSLIKDYNLTKSEVYDHLRSHWEEIQEPKMIIKELEEYQPHFIDITTGSNTLNLDKEAHLSLSSFYRLGAPSSITPFLMLLTQSYLRTEIAKGSFVDILLSVESFLVRRAVCGYEPTGLHAVFKKLWFDLNGDYSVDAVMQQIEKAKTVVWPKNDQFMESFKSRPLYSSRVTPYILMEYDRSLTGDVPNDKPWIEHVLPQRPVPEWNNHISHEDQKNLVDNIGNLLLLSSQMNRQLSNKDYASKCVVYINDSMFKSTRETAKRINTWDANVIRDRAQEIGLWAMSRWPY